jgi:hypothetical protein
MHTLPESLIHVLDHFAPLFSKRMWRWAVVMLVGAILAPGKRTVTAALRVMGLSDEIHFQNYHRLLSAAKHLISRFFARSCGAFATLRMTLVTIPGSTARLWGRCGQRPRR